MFSNFSLTLLCVKSVHGASWTFTKRARLKSTDWRMELYFHKTEFVQFCASHVPEF